ncbi:MAG: bifunctional metallophosphatase/5'-nucleotidase [Burkholderiaceae bacterium]|nr:bifunctional metallophosphatase/5'-nucleotidase [Burkholderiaceae bacterium]
MPSRSLPARATRRLLLVALLLAVSLPAAASELVAIRLIAFNDLHGHLEPGDNSVSLPDPRDPARRIALRTGGVAHLASAVRALRKEQPASLLLSTGDLVGASPLVSALFRDEPTIEVMNALGLDLGVVGNHEFDHGVAELRRLIGGGCAAEARGFAESCAGKGRSFSGARFPMIAANVEDAASGAPLLPPFQVKTVAGVRIGLIGAVTRATPGIVMPEGVRGWRFTHEAPALNRYARQLRAEGVELIVALVHEGGDADGGINGCDRPRGPIFDIVRALDPAIDVVLSAHTHQAYSCRIEGRVVIQGASFGRLLSVVDLQVDRATGRPVRAATRARNVPVANGIDADAAVAAAFPPYPADADVAALVDHYRSRSAPLAERPVGRIAAAFDRLPTEHGDSPAGRLIADAHLAATRDAGAQIAFTNSGGIRSGLQPRPPDGTVTFGDVFTMQPFGNTLVTMTLTGSQLKALLESQWRRDGARPHLLQPSSTLTYDWLDGAPVGARIIEQSIRIDGRPWSSDATYRITVNSYLAAGGDRFHVLADGADRSGGPRDVQALVQYLAQHSARAPLAPDPAPRIVRRVARDQTGPVR